jgi:outer membrane protein
MNRSSTFKTSVITVLTLFLYDLATAQQVHKLSALEASKMASSQIIEVKNAMLDYKLQEVKNMEVTGSARPQISGSGQLTHYLKLPQIQFPNTTDFNIYNVLIQEGILKDNGSGGAVKITQNNGAIGVNNLSFVAPWNAAASIQVNQLIFQPDVLIALQARKDALALAKENVLLAQEKSKEAAYKNYYGVLIARKQQTFLLDGITRLNKLISDQTQIYKNGFIEKLDIDKSTVSLNNLQSSVAQLNSAIAISEALLKQSLNLPQQDSIMLTDTLSEMILKENVLQDDTLNFNNRGEIRSLNAVAKLQGLDVKRNKMGNYPTVAAFANGGYNGQANPDFKAFTGKNWFWYSTILVGLNVTVPIYDGGQRKQKIQTAKLNMEKTLNTITGVKNAISMEQQIAKNSLQSALTSFDIQQRNIDLATKVYNAVKKKYEQGLSSAQEILLAEGDIQTAQSNYFKALYDAIIAKVSYQKALGKLQ